MCNITTTCIIFIFFLLWLIHQFFSCCYWAALIWNIFYLGQICVLQILFLNVVQFLLIIFSVKSSLYKNGDLKKNNLHSWARENNTKPELPEIKRKKNSSWHKMMGPGIFSEIGFSIALPGNTFNCYPGRNNSCISACKQYLNDI